ncbi:MAG: Flagellar biosynthetic protein FlhB, partial [Pseudomonadota bacterium]
MAEATGQERTEEPTARRLQKARKEGQIARSTEAPAAAVVIGALLAILLSGTWMAQRLTTGFASGFTFDRKTLDTPSLMLA